jgi:hypothetical protein
MDDRILFSHSALLRWIITNLLTDSQLDVVPPLHKRALRYYFTKEK